MCAGAVGAQNDVRLHRDHWIAGKVARGAVDAWEPLVVILHVHHTGPTQLGEVAEAGRLPCPGSRLGEDWEENGSQYCNDSNNHKKFDQGESATASDDPQAHGFPLPARRGPILAPQ
jgi:hypothetical protein